MKKSYVKPSLDKAATLLQRVTAVTGGKNPG